MHYALVHNNQIEVGPRQWLWSAFKDYLDENELDSSALPRKSPTEPIITDQWKLLPVEDLIQPPHTYPYEQLAGPFWTIHDDKVTGVWQVIPVDIEIAKGYLKGIITNNRYFVENAGIKANVQNEIVSVDTKRGERDIFFQTYLSMADTDTINWKFPEKWLTLSKMDLGMIVVTGKSHIQSSFDWEKTKWAEIDACTSREELEAVELNHPLQPVSEPESGLPE